MTLAVLHAPVEIQPERALAVVAQAFDGTLLRPDQKFNLRIEIPSGSVDLLNYRVTRNRLTGQWGCSCKGWVNWHSKKGDICCYHLKDMVPPLEKALELQAAAITQPAGVWY